MPRAGAGRDDHAPRAEGGRDAARVRRQRVAGVLGRDGRRAAAELSLTAAGRARASGFDRCQAHSARHESAPKPRTSTGVSLTSTDTASATSTAVRAGLRAERVANQTSAASETMTSTTRTIGDVVPAHDTWTARPK